MPISSLKTGSTSRSALTGNSAVGGSSGYYAIASNTLANSSTTTVSFTSIPSTYKSLELRCTWKPASNEQALAVYLNNVATGTSYSAHSFYGSTSQVTTNYNSAANKAYSDTGNYAFSANFGWSIWSFEDYASTSKNKTCHFIAGTGHSNGSATDYIFWSSLDYRSLTAVTRIDLAASLSFAIGSTFALYGIE